MRTQPKVGQWVESRAGRPWLLAQITAVTQTHVKLVRQSRPGSKLCIPVTLPMAFWMSEANGWTLEKP